MLCRLARLLLLFGLVLLLGSPAALAQRRPEPDPGPIPVGRDDPSRGSPNAPVTVVFFGDLQCPFCRRAGGTLDELQRHYGESKLRIVWKNYPLPFHQKARPAQEAGVAVFQMRGERAFWRYHAAALEALGAQQDHEGALAAAGVAPGRVQRLLASGGPARKVDEDMALGDKLGVRGTPCFFVNGVRISGAQPAAELERVVDQQLAEAAALRGKGVAAARIYAELSRRNYAPPEAAPPRPRAAAPAPAEDDAKSVHRVPVDGSPVLGSPAAWVTLVMFQDFQCPFCSRSTATVEKLRGRYGEKLRVVFKNHPLPFHQRAEPAAQLALEVRARQGDAAFWKASERLLGQQNRLEDADLEQVAVELGLDGPLAMQAVRSRKHAARIETDTKLAEAVGAMGTPTFFINGRRLVGARPYEDFSRLVDEEIEHARQLLGRGVPSTKLYDEILKSAVERPAARKTDEVAPVP
ncbi:MAG: thioredoxin domain-containing protein [Deltaproteobacteria bacterium]|nr:thioredoxin domain-containing protein [Deltaproteobacteria bacterium]